MTDLSPSPKSTSKSGDVPKAEAKPSTSNVLFEEVWRIWLDLDEGNVEKLRAVVAHVLAAGRAQAAADIREYAERLRSSSWNRHTGVALGAIADEAAKIAEGAVPKGATASDATATD